MNTVTGKSLLRAAGLVAWAFAGVPAVRHMLGERDCLPPWGFATWFGAFVVYGIAFWRASEAVGSAGTISRRAAALLAVQSVAAAGMLGLLCTGFESALLIVVAVELGLLLPLPAGLLWLVLQSALLFVLAARQMPWPRGAFWAAGAIGFEIFAFTVACIAGREAAARAELSQANAELCATRATLAQMSRDAERLRIARELHDLLGHDLVALHLNLEAAKHLAKGPAVEPIERAQGVAKGLLADLRKAVGELRDDCLVDVAAELRRIVEPIRVPRVHIEIPPRLEVSDPERANAVLRCVQEIVTNAMKHAEAQNLWIDLVPSDGRLLVRARDDGRGATEVTPGNGLAGMRERLERLGGELVLESAKGGGFRVRASLPVSGDAL